VQNYIQKNSYVYALHAKPFVILLATIAWSRLVADNTIGFVSSEQIIFEKEPIK